MKLCISCLSTTGDGSRPRCLAGPGRLARVKRRRSPPQILAAVFIGVASAMAQLHASTAITPRLTDLTDVLTRRDRDATWNDRSWKNGCQHGAAPHHPPGGWQDPIVVHETPSLATHAA